ncbi:MAG: hypothetical protein ABEH56_08560 [Salinirussus sp.]
MSEANVRIVAVALAVVVFVPGAVGATTAGPTASHDDTDAAFVVDLRADGSAEVTVRYTFDLSESTRAAAFETLRTNATVRQAFTDRFRDRMARVVAGVENATGRETSVTNASFDARTVGSTGVVELSVVVDGLARVEDRRIRLAEPFASGFSPDRPFRIVLPESSDVQSVTPSPADRSAGELSWPAGTDLAGFELVVSTGDTRGATDESAATGERTTTGGSGPGFGPVAVLAGLLVTLLLGFRR